MSFNGFQPQRSRGVEASTAFATSLIEALSISPVKRGVNQIHRLRKGSSKLATKRNSRFYSQPNRIAHYAAYRAIKSEPQIVELDKLYRYEDVNAVISFIKDNPSLLQLLNDAYHKIQQYFGAGTEVVLEVFTDYEVPTHRELIALAQTTLPISQALDRLDCLYQEWWAEASAVAPLKMSIDVESI